MEFMWQLVDVTQQCFFRKPGQHADHQRRQQQGPPEAESHGNQLETEIRTQQKESAMRKVDETQQAEHDTESDRHQEIQHPDTDTIDDLKQIDAHAAPILKVRHSRAVHGCRGR